MIPDNYVGLVWDHRRARITEPKKALCIVGFRMAPDQL